MRGVSADWINATLKVKENAETVINFDSVLHESYKRPRIHKDSATET